MATSAPEAAAEAATYVATAPEVARSAEQAARAGTGMHDAAPQSGMRHSEAAVQTAAGMAHPQEARPDIGTHGATCESAMRCRDAIMPSAG